MAETLTSGVTTTKNALRQASPWVWLFAADLDGTNAFRVCDGDAAITYGGYVFAAFPVTVQGFEHDSESLPRPTVTVSNCSAEIDAKLDAGGVIDRQCRIYQLTRADTSFAIDRGSWAILDCSMTAITATFTLGPYELFNAELPARRQHRSLCDNVYGQSECGYATSLPNLVAGTYPSLSVTTCDLTLDGANGCRAHGANEIANGRPALHPLRFGAKPGIPKGPARL